MSATRWCNSSGACIRLKRAPAPGCFFAPGDYLFAQAVQRQAELEALVYAPELSGRNSFVNQMFIAQRNRGMPCYALAREIYRSLGSPTAPRDAIGAVVRQRWETLEAVFHSPALGWIALDRMPDLREVGVILRTSQAIGGAGLIVLSDCMEVYDPVCVQASAGALFSQALVATDFQEFVAWKRAAGRPIFLVGLDLPEGAALDYKVLWYPRPVIILLRHTDLALPSGYREICDSTVYIPTVPPPGGRNYQIDPATAAGLLLYEAFNQQRGMERPWPADTLSGAAHG